MPNKKMPRPSWNSNGATEENLTVTTHSVPRAARNALPHPWIVVRPARMFKVYETWPHGSHVALRVHPGELFTIDVDRVRSERPDLDIRVQSTCPATAHRWQAALTFGALRALHGPVIA